MRHVVALALAAGLPVFGCSDPASQSGASNAPTGGHVVSPSTGSSGSNQGNAGSSNTTTGAGGDLVPVPVAMPDAAPPRGSCGLEMPAFCDDFEVPSPSGRGGDLDEREWSVARINNVMNPTQGQLDAWPPTVASACGKE